MQVPCKVCGEFECRCKYLLAKAVISILDGTATLREQSYLRHHAEEIIWEAEREV